ncbi:hypothetical protein [Nonlabens antarcticus]|uniref:hypothetical protein n=1 Tax=Nonlabens antarcticus TaxID=392714 RepID=UPI001890F79F|nr:hypothetical protein [Nonlabens antarcticus]
MRKLIGLIVIVIISVCCTSDQRKKLFGQDKFTGALEYKLSRGKFQEDLDKLLNNDDISFGYTRNGKMTGNTYSFYIAFQNPDLVLDDEQAVLQLTQQVNPLIAKHVSNLDKYVSYQVHLVKSEIIENLEKKQSVIVTQEINTTKTDETN